jgi:hypothetical protein
LVFASEYKALARLTLCSAARYFPVDIGSETEPSGEGFEGKKTMLASVETEAPASIPLPGPDSSGDDLFRMGLLYSTGQGGAPLDYVSAHMLFNLAAMRGSQEAKIYRKELSAEMDPVEVAEAQRNAREWLAQA